MIDFLLKRYSHMNKLLKNDLEQLGSLLESTAKISQSVLNGIDKRPTSSKPNINKRTNLSAIGLGAANTLELFMKRFDPSMVASSGPRYWGYVTGGATPAAVVGDWLTSIYDQNTQATKGSGDVSAIIEIETIELLLDFFGLPDSFLGGFVTGATLSNFTSLAVGRQWLGMKLGKDIARDGNFEELNIASATPHSSALKCLSMLGIGRNNIQYIETMKGNREAIDIQKLENYIKNLSGKPFLLISSAGTVNSTDFDDFKAIAKLKKKYEFWWHIDAAFGAFAACSPLFENLVDGWEFSDSITIDCHKWLNVPYDSAVFLIKKEHRHLQLDTFKNSNAPYLGDPIENFNYLNFLPENSRRLRALPTWFTLLAYGKSGYQEIVENCVKLAKEFGKLIEDSSKFELLAPVRLNTVCFKVSDFENLPSFLEHLNQSGEVFMTPTKYLGEAGIRAAFVNWRTTPRDLEIAMAAMIKALNESKTKQN